MNLRPIGALGIVADRIVLFFGQQGRTVWRAFGQKGEVMRGRDDDPFGLRQARDKIAAGFGNIRRPHEVFLTEIDHQNRHIGRFNTILGCRIGKTGINGDGPANPFIAGICRKPARHMVKVKIAL